MGSDVWFIQGFDGRWFGGSNDDGDKVNWLPQRTGSVRFLSESAAQKRIDELGLEAEPKEF